MAAIDHAAGMRGAGRQARAAEQINLSLPAATGSCDSARVARGVDANLNSRAREIHQRPVPEPAAASTTRAVGNRLVAIPPAIPVSHLSAFGASSSSGALPPPPGFKRFMLSDLSGKYLPLIKDYATDAKRGPLAPVLDLNAPPHCCPFNVYTKSDHEYERQQEKRRGEARQAAAAPETEEAAKSAEEERRAAKVQAVIQECLSSELRSSSPPAETDEAATLNRERSAQVRPNLNRISHESKFASVFAFFLLSPLVLSITGANQSECRLRARSGEATRQIVASGLLRAVFPELFKPRKCASSVPTEVMMLSNLIFLLDFQYVHLLLFHSTWPAKAISRLLMIRPTLSALTQWRLGIKSCSSSRPSTTR